MAQKTYTTVSGQTWDQIAFKVYGSEKYCENLMEENPDLMEYMIFPAGITINLPEDESFLETEISANYPDWRKQLDN